MIRTLLILLALFHGLNGLAMLAFPDAWYGSVPDVTETGPFNRHFVNDIGLAFLAAAAALLLAARRNESRPLGLLGAASVFLSGHALLHVVEMVALGPPAGDILRDAALILLPRVLAGIDLATIVFRETAMMRALMKRQAAKFGKNFDYDIAYIDHLIDVDPAAAAKFALAGSFLEHRGGLAPLPWFAAKLRSSLAADCGLCLKLAVTMAEREGVARVQILAILRGKYETEDTRIAGAFADAVVANTADVPERVEEARSYFGERGLGGLSIAVVSGQFYPLFKRGLGHGMACDPVLRELELA